MNLTVASLHVHVYMWYNTEYFAQALPFVSLEVAALEGVGKTVENANKALAAFREEILDRATTPEVFQKSVPTSEHTLKKALHKSKSFSRKFGHEADDFWRARVNYFKTGLYVLSLLSKRTTAYITQTSMPCGTDNGDLSDCFWFITYVGAN
ncbi:hypothetical protein CROQUDRAFT_136687 [Cronartium quercuum f. sp. fusiforme G11]|uniref:Uncharacterized protein n=1 Tax=Cronartium quercuum f. sp. fusiforme G11 TaxID=708437 RepID=A0A9P6T7H4_9BASI|nr:hypothetical protein CROQUDRAFT_136687 [Cronartium quercuum f. sp. fusiforme G11]